MNSEEYIRMSKFEKSHFWYEGMREIIKSVVSNVSLPREARILDVGCGTGGNMELLGLYGKVEGVDISEQAVNMCRKKGLKVRRLDALHLDVHERFDLVCCFEVLYHEYISDDLSAIANMAQALKPGGWLMIREPAMEILRRGHDRAVMARKRYTKKEMRSLFEANGVKVKKLTYLNFLLLPLMLVSKLLFRDNSDLQEMGWLVDRVLLTVLRVEALFVRWIDFPIGSSILCLGQKPIQPNSLVQISSRNKRERSRKAKNTSRK